MDSQIPNKAALEWVKAGHLFPEKVQVTPEKTYGNSRFDLYVCSEKRKAFIEVKGVTLESDNIARFPDARDRKRCETSEGADPLYAGRIRSLSASGDPDEGS